MREETVGEDGRDRGAGAVHAVRARIVYVTPFPRVFSQENARADAREALERPPRADAVWRAIRTRAARPRGLWEGGARDAPASDSRERCERDDARLYTQLEYNIKFTRADDRGRADRGRADAGPRASERD